MESLQTVVLDTNVIIKEIQEGRILKPIAKRMKKYKSKLVMLEIILGEVGKVTGSDSITTMERVYQYCKHPIMMDKTNDISSESQ